MVDRPLTNVPRRRTAGPVCARRLVLSMLLLLALGPGESKAIDWEKMVMPGPLFGGHAEFESDCATCHKAFDVGMQRALCLDCHEKVSADVTKKEGFHGRHPLAALGQCRSCHPDHRGRDADIRGLSDSTFDHDHTDYPLVGAHQSTPCADCHVPEVARRDAPTGCFACHESDDAHKGALSEDCGKCHDEVRWRNTRFDHAETGYELSGAHAEASCVGCHVGARYKDTPRDCASCHSIDDAHGGRFGSDCASCHGTKTWAQKGFDHERESGFPLLGAHAKATCVTCHRQPPGERELPEDCASCHAPEDVHAGRFGTACNTCHTSFAWTRVSFDHGKKTDFPLRGAHGKAACTSCHSGTNKRTAREATCIACHAPDDVHEGNLGQDCDGCHTEISFAGRVSFDHDLTEFPLLGLHAMSSCESCHKSHTYRHTDRSCSACHMGDDVHERTLGSECSTCHNPNGWDVWRFDHDVRTGFELHGAHRNLECRGCHTKPVTTGFQMAQTCVECHSSDDAHRGGFGRSCENCHGVEAWKPAILGRRRGESR